MATSGVTPGQAAGISAGLGALAGLFPQTSSGITSGSYANTATGSSTGTFDMNTIMNFINNLNSLVTGSQTGTTTGTSTTGVTPTLSPEETALMTKLMTSAGSLSAPSLTGYSAQQTSNINANAQAQENAVNNIMASRGLATSPVAATAQAGVEQNRQNQITNMQQQLPLLQNQLNLQNLAGATSLFASLPKGSQTTGTSAQQTAQQSQQQTQQQQTGQQTTDQTGTSASTQNQTSAGTSKGTTNTSAGGGIGGALGGASAGFAAALPYLIAFSDERLKDDIEDVPQDKAIALIRGLKGKSWNWKGSTVKSSGVVAQDLEKILPHLVHDIPITDDGDTMKAVNYNGLVPYLIGAIQNLDKRVGA